MWPFVKERPRRGGLRYLTSGKCFGGGEKKQISPLPIRCAQGPVEMTAGLVQRLLRADFLSFSDRRVHLETVPYTLEERSGASNAALEDTILLRA
jgi:hypothetical protein